MNSNRYAPPRALVADPDPDRPRSVTAAVYVLWLTFAVSILAVSYKFVTDEAPPTSGTVMTGIILVVFSPFAWINVKIAAGRNWARIAYIVIQTGGAAVSLASLGPGRILPAGSVDKVFLAAQAVLLVTAVALLLSPPANRWFRRSVN